MMRLTPRSVPPLARWRSAFYCVLLLACNPSGDKTAPPAFSVAVAANFYPTAQKIAALYKQKTGSEVQLAQGSTGKLYAQITQGAPFELFLSADAERPARLHKEGQQGAADPTTFAIGRLALVCSKRSESACQELSRHPQLSPNDLRVWLLQRARLAVADPHTAPYGRAAEQTLQALGIADAIQPRLVMGQSVAQAFHFAESDNVEVAFVAVSQARSVDRLFIPIPTSLYATLRHDAVVLRHSKRADAFLKFLIENTQARRLTAEAGYLLPSDDPRKR